MIHRRTSTTITLGFDEVRGFDHDYAYDPIGNRTSATYYDEQGEAVASAYSANALNQYTQRTVPGNVQIRGEADTDAVVTVNENPTWRYPSLGGSAAQTSPRSGATSAQPQLRRKAAETSVEVGGGSASYFYGGDYADNTAVPVFKEVEVAAVVPATSPDGWDEMSAVTGRVFVAQNPEQFTYDADGNMTSDGRFRYTWNGENRLVRAQELCAPTNRHPYTVTYAYDHRGRMVSKRITENDGNDTLVKSTTYLWDGWNIIRETQWPVTSDQWSAGPLATNHYPLVTDYVWGLDLDGTLQGAGGVGGLLAVVKSDCTTNNSAFCILHSALYLPTYDANGNISEYIDESGEIVAHYDYSPFGETLIESGDLASTFTHRFSTKPWCPVTGLCEYQKRKYRPEIGRWLSRDPIEERDSANIFAFCHNNPCIIYDQLGLYSRNQLNSVIEHHNVQVSRLSDYSFQPGARCFNYAKPRIEYRCICTEQNKIECRIHFFPLIVYHPGEYSDEVRGITFFDHEYNHTIVYKKVWGPTLAALYFSEYADKACCNCNERLENVVSKFKELQARIARWDLNTEYASPRKGHLQPNVDYGFNYSVLTSAVNGILSSGVVPCEK